ncbi:FAD-dependent oxidoreductase [Petrocella sp. FN5]|uniref:FAD-dependent oxidoreductase n=1 Tax=Petrocella sp. FN5 TaxID=3032002 RepID=UPI0023D9A709|nr:FAD-dependent oxidoreductase [Petrocella sp. FN5]MDF1618134.1 FAD-dependent oxidoreductase [Petrocella sp. FN5]
MSKKVLIVGGVAGGAGTAARLRRMDSQAKIIMFEKGPYISFANCGLPYYIGGTIKNREELLLQTPEGFGNRFKVDVRINNEVLKIDRENKKVIVKDITTLETYEETYDTLVLSTGSTPLVPKIEGIDSPNIFTLWTIPDVDRIKEYVLSHDLKTATVIGGGFIGLEMAENLHDLGLDVSIAEMAPQVMMSIDYDMAQLIHGHIAKKSVHLHLNNGVKSFKTRGTVTDVILNDETAIESDIILLAIGVKPNGSLAIESGLKTNERGGIVVDSNLRTSDPDIFALGDVIEVEDFVSGQMTMVPLAGPANKQARIVADNITGLNKMYKGTQGTSVAKVFDMTVASTGNNEKSLERQGLVYGKDYLISIITKSSHADYYPGAKDLTIKLIFNMEGRILGAQAIGQEGVEKRIDVIATAIRFGARVKDLIELELSYAPPYSSAKDPVNMVAYVADNIMSQKMVPIRSEEIQGLDKSKTLILDVRTPEEVAYGALEGHTNIPLDDLRERIQELPSDREIIIYCAVGFRGYLASTILNPAGFKTRNLLGGYNYYRKYLKKY